MRYRLIFAVCVAAVGAWTLLAAPSSVVVDASGHVAGGLSQLREVVQGRRFWEHQLVVVEAELARVQSYPAKFEKIREDTERAMEPVMRETQDRMEAFYKEHPELRPSRARQHAEQLREQANQIDARESERFMRSIFEAQARDLELIRSAITAKLGP